MWAEGLAARTSRRGLLARVGRAMVAGAAGGVVAKAIKPGEAEAFHFCGHIYTTASCPHPTGLPRIDQRGYPLRAKDGKPVDDLGRRIDAEGRPVDEHGALLADPDGQPLPVATRTKVCTNAAALYGFDFDALKALNIGPLVDEIAKPITAAEIPREAEKCPAFVGMTGGK